MAVRRNIRNATENEDKEKARWVTAGSEESAVCGDYRVRNIKLSISRSVSGLSGQNTAISIQMATTS